MIEEAGESPDDDLHLAGRGQLDLALHLQLTRRLALFAELIDLTDSPIRHFQGRRDRPVTVEHNGWWGIAGVRLDF